MSSAIVTSSISSAAAPSTAIIASADVRTRTRIAATLRSGRWKITEVSGGAEAITVLGTQPADALIVDHWLPDLEVREFAELVQTMFPEIELIRMAGTEPTCSGRSSRHSELQLAVQSACGALESRPTDRTTAGPGADSIRRAPPAEATPESRPEVASSRRPDMAFGTDADVAPLPDMVGVSRAMRQVARLIRLVAPRSTTVLIEGATGTGKELVAAAVHRLSRRAGKPFVTLNCAAIPESLLEAELFGHTRGAFTGAVQSRVGRVEAANGGTLFLDEIGEMPLALQAKMLRFLESGEIQRIGGNETVRVDVRIVAATHQPLKQRAGENAFRLDLYHRLAVFPVRVPPLCDRMEDVPALAQFFLAEFGKEAPVKCLSALAEQRLMDYSWPGNVRELAHVLERASILAEDRPEIAADEIWF